MASDAEHAFAGDSDGQKLPSAMQLSDEEPWDDWPSAAPAPDSAAAAPESAASAPELALAAPESDDIRHFRHLPGTWKVWEGTWFYITKTPGWIDVKCCLKHQFRQGEEGMGTSSMSRTLSPHHYGDVWEDPWRTLLLLRSWSIWRARWQGWARAKEFRMREVGRQVARFTAELRQAHLDHDLALAVPLLGNATAHHLLVKWTADVVSAVLA